MSSSVINWKIEVADSGETIQIQFNTHNLTIDSFKDRLSNYVSIPAKDQVILVGPPYKRLEECIANNDFNKDMTNQRIFLYNKLVFESDAKEPIEVKLGPFDIMGVSNFSDLHSHLDASQSPVIKLLRDYEVNLLRAFKRGESALGTMEKCRSASISSLERQNVQKSALHAALNNLTVYFNNFKPKFTQHKDKFIALHSKHSDMLRTFEKDIYQLKQIPLISGLASKIGISSSNSISASGGGGGGGKHFGTSAISVNANSSSKSIENLSIANSTSEHYRTNNTGDSVTSESADLTPYLVEFGDSQDGNNNNNSNSNNSNNGNNSNSNSCSINSHEEKKIGAVSHRFVSLLDCIPEDKFRGWAHSFGDVHGQIDKELEKLNADYASISESVDKLDNCFSDSMSEYEIAIQQIISKMDIIISSSQSELLDRLRKDYLRVFEETELIQGDETKIGNFIGQVLVPISKKQAEDRVLESLERSAREILILKDDVAKIQTKLMKSVYESMRGIARTQTNTDKLKKMIERLKEWRKGRNEYFRQLETVRKLPEGYYNFLREVHRRHKFQSYFDGTLDAMDKEIARIRATEKQSRQEYVNTWGAFIPETFFQVMPSLREPPPVVKISSTDPQWLPEITAEEAGAIASKIKSSGLASSASSANFVQEFAPAPRADPSQSVDSLILRIKELEYENELLRGARSRSSSKDSAEPPLQSAATTTTTSATILANTNSNSCGDSVSIEKQAIYEPINNSNDKNDNSNSNSSNSSSNSSSSSSNSNSSSSSSLAARLRSIFEVDDRPVMKELEGVLSPELLMLPADEDALTYVERIYRGLLLKIDDCKAASRDKKDISSIVMSHREQSVAASEPINSVLKLNNFKTDDLLMFVCGGRYKNFVAFNIDCPLYYLNPDCLQMVKERRGADKPGDPIWILGKIIYLESHFAVPGKNPFTLREGTQYHVVDIEYVKSG